MKLDRKSGIILAIVIATTPLLGPVIFEAGMFGIAIARTGANPWAGRKVIAQRNCTKCHSIPGFSSVGSTGPDLHGVAWRDTIAKGYANSPKSLAAWLQKPSQYTPYTDMPDTKLSEEEAKQVAAYLWGVSK